LYKIQLKGQRARLFLDDILTIAVLKGLLFKKEEVVNEVSFNDVKEVSVTNEMLTITYKEGEKTSTLKIEFINAEDAKDVEGLINKHLEKRKIITGKINEIVTITNNIGLTSDAIFGLALSLDKKCNWQKANEEYQRLVDEVEALSSTGLDLNKKILEEIKTKIEEREPERTKELILDFVKDLYSVVSNIKEAEPLVEMSPSWKDLKQFMELLLLVGALSLVLRRGLLERTEEINETIYLKLSELEPLVDKQYVNKIRENIESGRYEAVTEAPSLLADGIKARSQKLS